MTDESKAGKQMIFDEDRGEAAFYEAAPELEEIPLPITRIGFAALLERSAVPGVPVDDSCRKVIAGWIHHIGNETDTCTIAGLRRVLRKSLANALSWTIDQEIKAKQQAALDARIAERRAAAVAEAQAQHVAQVGSETPPAAAQVDPPLTPV